MGHAAVFLSPPRFFDALSHRECQHKQWKMPPDFTMCQLIKEIFDHLAMPIANEYVNTLHFGIRELLQNISFYYFGLFFFFLINR